MRRNSFSAERLKELRLEKGLTQTALAEGIGLYHSNVVRYEQGYIRPTVDVLGRICDVLGCSADYLLCRIDTPNHEV